MTDEFRCCGESGSLCPSCHAALRARASAAEDALRRLEPIALELASRAGEVYVCRDGYGALPPLVAAVSHECEQARALLSGGAVTHGNDANGGDK